MKKQIGDLTLREIKSHCKFNTYGLVAGICSYCEFNNICHTKIAMLLSDGILEQEIEVEEMHKGTELTGKIGHVSKIMERELEGLERLAMPDELHNEECKKAGVELTEDYDLVKKALLELKSIKEANPSEALNQIDFLILDCVTTPLQHEALETVKQALQKLDRYEQILSGGRLTDRNYKNTTLDIDSCKPYLRLGQLEDIYEEGQ